MAADRVQGLIGRSVIRSPAEVGGEWLRFDCAPQGSVLRSGDVRTAFAGRLIGTAERGQMRDGPRR